MDIEPVDNLEPLNYLQITAAKQYEYRCDLDPDTNTTLLVYLHREVPCKNVELIRTNVMSGQWKCAVVRPSVIVDPLQIAVAANKAVLSMKNKTLTTKSVYTEILFNLSITKAITQSLCKFGIDRDPDMLICFLVTPESDNSKEILAQIEGRRCLLGELRSITKYVYVKNMYKINGLKCDMTEVGLRDLIISRMATKNIISY